METSELVTIFLTLEIQAFVFYTIVSIKKENIFAAEGGLKYFLIGLNLKQRENLILCCFIPTQKSCFFYNLAEKTAFSGKLTRKERAAYMLRNKGILTFARKPFINDTANYKIMRFGLVGIKTWVNLRKNKPNFYSMEYISMMSYMRFAFNTGKNHVINTLKNTSCTLQQNITIPQKNIMHRDYSYFAKLKNADTLEKGIQHFYHINSDIFSSNETLAKMAEDENMAIVLTHTIPDETVIEKNNLGKILGIIELPAEKNGAKQFLVFYNKRFEKAILAKGTPSKEITEKILTPSVLEQIHAKIIEIKIALKNNNEELELRLLPEKNPKTQKETEPQYTPKELHYKHLKKEYKNWINTLSDKQKEDHINWQKSQNAPISAGQKLHHELHLLKIEKKGKKSAEHQDNKYKTENDINTPNKNINTPKNNNDEID